MKTQCTDMTVPGLDSTANSIINQRNVIVQAFLTTRLDAATNWCNGPYESDNCQDMLSLLDESQTTQDELLPLAQELGIHDAVERVRVLSCWKHGFFDYQKKNRKRIIRPPFDEVLDQVHNIRQTHVYAQDKVDALLRQNVCSNEANASRVIDRLRRVDSWACEQARDVIRAYIQYGMGGLLKHSNYPGTDELLLLHQYAPIISDMCDQSDWVFATLRADIRALYHALHDKQVVFVLLQKHGISGDMYERASQIPANGIPKQAKNIVSSGLWRQDMLHQPQYSQERQSYRESITADVRARIVVALMEYRDCDEIEATELFEIFIARGLAGIIDWRCAVSDPSQAFVMQRIHRSLDVHIPFLKPVFRQEIERLLVCVQQTIDDMKLSVTLFPLVDEYPRAPYRHQFEKMLRADRHIVVTFAHYAELDKQEASARLHAFARYGGIGLLRLTDDQLNRMIDPRLVQFIHFQKLAHLDQGVNRATLVQQVNAYAETLDHPHLSTQVVQALFNRSLKERYWNSGKGGVMDAFRHRSSLTLRKTPLLHRAWVLIPIQLSLPIVDDSNNRIGDSCYVLLVLDHDSILPIGCWTSAGKLGVNEVGLALYQAIWHAGKPDWPLRGVPETILLPPSLGLTDSGLANVYKAAEFLMIEHIEEYKKERYWRKQNLITKLRDNSASALYRNLGQRSATCQQIQDTVLLWLYDERFSTHRSPVVPTKFSSVGFAMPGYDSPAAGWLLPQMGEVQTVRDGVVRGSVLYNNANFRSSPGQVLPYRVFPFVYTGMERGLFVEQGANVQYVTRSKDIPI